MSDISGNELFNRQKELIDFNFILYSVVVQGDSLTSMLMLNLC